LKTEASVFAIASEDCRHRRGEGSVIERAILDKDCRIGRPSAIINKENTRNEECANYVIRDAFVVIPKGLWCRKCDLMNRVMI